MKNILEKSKTDQLQKTRYRLIHSFIDIYFSSESQIHCIISNLLPSPFYITYNTHNNIVLLKYFCYTTRVKRLLAPVPNPFIIKDSSQSWL